MSKIESGYGDSPFTGNTRESSDAAGIDIVQNAGDSDRVVGAAKRDYDSDGIIVEGSSNGLKNGYYEYDKSSDTYRQRNNDYDRDVSISTTSVVASQNKPDKNHSGRISIHPFFIFLLLIAGGWWFFRDKLPSISDFMLNRLVESTSTQKFAESDLAGKSAWELTLMRNYPFARHGFVFGNSKTATEIKKFFLSKSWYHPSIKSQDVCWKKMSEIEHANTDLIRKYQKKNGLMWSADGKSTEQRAALYSPPLAAVPVAPAETSADYEGSTGSIKALFHLTWRNATKEVNGTYYTLQRPDRRYELRGTNPTDGQLSLEEFTDGTKTATVQLTKVTKSGRVIWQGTMHNTDGRKFSVRMERSAR